jgi:hypothetical protein
MTGCGDPATATFDVAASKAIAADKGLRPGGPARKVVGQGRRTTDTGDNSFRKP